MKIKQSRNKREGRYHGKILGQYFRGFSVVRENVRNQHHFFRLLRPKFPSVFAAGFALENQVRKHMVVVNA